MSSVVFQAYATSYLSSTVFETYATSYLSSTAFKTYATSNWPSTVFKPYATSYLSSTAFKIYATCYFFSIVFKTYATPYLFSIVKIQFLEHLLHLLLPFIFKRRCLVITVHVIVSHAKSSKAVNIILTAGLLFTETKLTHLQYGNMHKMDGPTEQCADPLPSVVPVNCSSEFVSTFLSVFLSVTQTLPVFGGNVLELGIARLRKISPTHNVIICYLAK